MSEPKNDFIIQYCLNTASNNMNDPIDETTIVEKAERLWEALASKEYVSDPEAVRQLRQKLTKRH